MAAVPGTFSPCVLRRARTNGPRLLLCRQARYPRLKDLRITHIPSIFNGFGCNLGGIFSVLPFNPTFFCPSWIGEVFRPPLFGCVVRPGGGKVVPRR